MPASRPRGACEYVAEGRRCVFALPPELEREGCARFVSRRRAARTRRVKSREVTAPLFALREVRRSAVWSRPHSKVSKVSDESGALLHPDPAPLRRKGSVGQRSRLVRPSPPATRPQAPTRQSHTPLRPHEAAGCPDGSSDVDKRTALFPTGSRLALRSASRAHAAGGRGLAP